MNAKVETIIGEIHDNARDSQRNHMFLYQAEQLVAKQLYRNVAYDFKSKLFECKTTFSQISVHCFVATKPAKGAYTTILKKECPKNQG